MSMICRDFFPDVIIMCDDKINAHKILLMNTFKYFETMYTSGVPSPENINLMYSANTIKFITGVLIYKDFVGTEINVQEVLACADFLGVKNEESLINKLLTFENNNQDEYVELLIHFPDISKGYLSQYIDCNTITPDNAIKLINTFIPIYSKNAPFTYHAVKILKHMPDSTVYDICKHTNLIDYIITSNTINGGQYVIAKYINIATFDEVYNIYTCIINSYLNLDVSIPSDLQYICAPIRANGARLGQDKTRVMIYRLEKLK